MQTFKVTQGVRGGTQEIFLKTFDTFLGVKVKRLEKVIHWEAEELAFMVEAQNDAEAAKMGHELAYAVNFHRDLLPERSALPEEWAANATTAEGQREDLPLVTL